MNSIHPSAIIGREVRLGEGNVVGPFAVIGDGARIGDGNWIGAHTVIGAPPEVRSVEHRAEWIDGDGAGVVIGDGNVIREAVQVHAGWKSTTTLGSGLFVMNQSYIAHDARLGDDVTLASHVTLAGHVTVGRGANLGLSTVVHQGRTIGAFAMVGMGSVVTHDLPPFVVAYGSPARPSRANTVGLERAGFEAAAVSWVEAWAALGFPVEGPGIPPTALAPYLSEAT